MIYAVEAFDHIQGYIGSRQRKSGTEQRKSGIFISYRREDTAWPARCLHDRLCNSFGADQVFMDVSSIAKGENFPNEIRYRMSRCSVLLALIGHDWLGTASVTRTRRINNPDDWVHVEVKTALEQDIWAVPVLIDGTKMPKSSELPDGLQPLTRVNAFELHHDDLDREAAGLIAQIDRVRKGYKILQGKWSLDLQSNEGSEYTFRLSSDSRDYVITISLTNRGKSFIRVDGQVVATGLTSAGITGKELPLEALSKELDTRATIKVQTLSSARSYLDKPVTSYRFELTAGNRIFEYKSEEYARAEERRRLNQQEEQRKLEEKQQSQALKRAQQMYRQPQGTEQAVEQALRRYAASQAVGNALVAALKNESVQNALKNALKRGKG